MIPNVYKCYITSSLLIDYVLTSSKQHSIQCWLEFQKKGEMNWIIRKGIQVSIQELVGNDTLI